ncbi:MAG: tetratricopeptide repeat protein [Saprospiraceae bacterium]|nr:tetratricopeptide repeat protein [Saprospiraceae bacterium]
MSKKNKPKAEKQLRPPHAGEQSDWNVWIVMLSAVPLYAITIGFDFVLDDEIMTRSNTFVMKGIAGIGDIFTHGTLYGFNGMNDQSYRPLMLAIFALERSLFGGSSGAFHFFNVFYYALACGAFYLFIKRAMGRERLIPLLAALLFVAHPIHTEVVANIKSRDEILSFMFVCLSLLYVLKYIQEGNKSKNLIISLVCYLAATLAKETGLAMLGLIPLTLWFFTDLKRSRIAGLTAIFLAPVAVYFLMRAAAMDNMFFSSDINDLVNNTLSGARSSGEWFASRTMILGKYLGLLVFPHPLSYDYSYNQVPLVGLSDPWFILSLILHIVLAGLFVWGLFYKKIFSYAVGFYAIMMVLVSNFITPIGATMAERFLFSASAGFCLALAWGIASLVEKFRISKNILYTVVAGILLLYTVKTYTRTQVWGSQEKLFKSGLETAPNSARAQNHFGTYWRMLAEGIQNPQDKNKADLNAKAVVYYQKALEIYPEYSEAQYNLGVTHLALNNTEDARIAFEKTLKIDSTYEGALNNLGIIAFRKGDAQEALAYWNKLLTKNPNNFDALQNCGAVYFNNNDPKKALEYFERALKINPKHAGLNQNIQKVRAALQQKEG